MESPNDRYKKILRTYGVNFRKEASLRFQNKYVNKIWENGDLGDTNEKEIVLKLGKFVQGKIYTFKYQPLYKENYDYYDTQPIVLVLNQIISKNGTELMTGINFSFFPEIIRVNFLETFWNEFKSEIKLAEQSVERGMLGVTPKIKAFFSDFKILNDLFESTGIHYKFAYRTYIINRIKNLNMMEYQDWELIPFITNGEIEGQGISKIHTEYYKINKK